MRFLICSSAQSNYAANVLLLEVAVCNVVVAPVGHRIKLQAVGKLHLVGLAKLLELLPSLLFSPVLPCPRASSLCVGAEFLKLEALSARSNAGRREYLQGEGGAGWRRKERR